jgi:hypothetical protein
MCHSNQVRDLKQASTSKEGWIETYPINSFQLTAWTFAQCCVAETPKCYTHKLPSERTSWYLWNEFLQIQQDVNKLLNTVRWQSTKFWFINRDWLHKRRRKSSIHVFCFVIHRLKKKASKLNLLHLSVTIVLPFVTVSIYENS